MIDHEPSREHERIIDHCLIFDVDGVLTDPKTKEVTDETVLNALSERLKNGEPVILYTGRAIDFVLQKIIPRLELGSGKEKLENVLVVAEKGGVVVLYDKQGNPKILEDQSYAVPSPVHDLAKKLVAEKYRDNMFYDATKRTMLTVEMVDNGDIEKFAKDQKEIVKDFAAALSAHGVSDQFKIDPTVIATDIEHIDVGKALGVRKALWWLGQKNINPKEFLTFGDSQSDMAMAEELDKLGKPGRFVFVGDPTKIAGTRVNFPIVQTNGRFEQGVKEFLSIIQ